MTKGDRTKAGVVVVVVCYCGWVDGCSLEYVNGLWHSRKAISLGGYVLTQPSKCIIRKPMNIT